MGLLALPRLAPTLSVAEATFTIPVVKSEVVLARLPAQATLPPKTFRVPLAKEVAAPDTLPRETLPATSAPVPPTVTVPMAPEVGEVPEHTPIVTVVASTVPWSTSNRPTPLKLASVPFRVTVPTVRVESFRSIGWPFRKALPVVVLLGLLVGLGPFLVGSFLSTVFPSLVVPHREWLGFFDTEAKHRYAFSRETQDGFFSTAISETAKGQVYIRSVNWALMLATMALVVGFRSSSRLASAYGIAVTMDMTITTVMTFFVLHYGWKYPLALCAAATGFFFVIDARPRRNRQRRFLWKRQRRKRRESLPPASLRQP